MLSILLLVDLFNGSQHAELRGQLQEALLSDFREQDGDLFKALFLGLGTSRC